MTSTSKKKLEETREASIELADILIKLPLSTIEILRHYGISVEQILDNITQCRQIEKEINTILGDKHDH